MSPALAAVYKPRARLLACLPLSQSPANAKLVVVRHDPAKVWRLRLGWALSLVCAVLLSWWYARSSLGPDLAETRIELTRQREELAAARMKIEQLERELAVQQRSAQVAERAREELQQALAARQEELASLRNDLGFYQRLMESGSQQAGIAVHSLQLRASEDPRSFLYQLTLSQNLKRNRVAQGSYEIQVIGSVGGELRRLSLKDLGDSANDQRFSFRYFQQINGLLMLPADFVATGVNVRAELEGGERVQREFAWAELVRPLDKAQDRPEQKR